MLAAEGALPVNVRVACDGEEETGGHSIVEWVEADERGADVCIIFDAGMPEVGCPGLLHRDARARLLPRQGAHRRPRPPLGRLRGRRAERDARAHADARARRWPSRTSCAAGSSRRPTKNGRAGPRRSRDRPRSTSRARLPRDDRAADEFYERTLAGAAVDVHGLAGGSPLLQKTVIPVEAEANVSIRLAPVQDVEEIALADGAAHARRRAARRPGRDRALVVGARRARRSRRARREARAGRLRARARPPAAPPSLGRHAADRPCACRPGHSHDRERLRPPGRERPRAERGDAAPLHPARRRDGARDRSASSRSSSATVAAPEWSCSGTSQSWPNCRIASMIGRSAWPFGVSSYSTRGGDSG